MEFPGSLTYDERTDQYIDALKKILKFWGVDSIGRGNIINTNFQVVLKIPANIGSFSYGIVSPNEKLSMTWSTRVDSTTEAYLWDMENGNQFGLPLLHSASIIDGLFNKNGNEIVTWDDDNVVRVFKKVNLNLQNYNRGDSDFPRELFKRQMEVTTGVRLNEQKNGIETIPLNEWHELSRNWMKNAEAHYKNCK
jgi:WD40 repeat protein